MQLDPRSRRSTRRRAVAIGLGAVCLLAATIPAHATDGIDLGQRALEYVAAQQGVPIGDLRIAEETSSHLPVTDLDLQDFKILALDGRSFGVSFDLGTGEVVDAAAADMREQQARLSAYGAIDPPLYRRLQASTADTVRVAIWLVMADPSAVARGGAGLAALESSVQVVEAPVVDAVTALDGTEPHPAVLVADGAPVVFAQLSADSILALATRPDVSMIYEVPSNVTDLIDDSATSDHYPYVWPSASGSGATVAVSEDDGIDDTNPFLDNATHGIAYWSDSVGDPRNIGSHATNVAGIIASTNSWRRGGAFGISRLLSANFQSFSDPVSIVNSATWAVANGADTVNMSWGGCTNGGQNFYSRWVDYFVKTTGANVVVSAGNGSCSPAFVDSPGLAWNVISVGSYFDNDTGLRTDDALSTFSSFVNPVDPTSGRSYEKPDVVGMGGQLDATGCHGVETTAVGGGFDTRCGTSFSAPDVAALTALAIGRRPALAGAPEAVKAIVMAGATHNIVDGPGYMDCPLSPVAGDCRDGAGGIDAMETINGVVTRGNWRFAGAIDPGSFDASGNLNYPANFTANKSARVVIAWDSSAACSNLGTPTQSCASDVLNADLDLNVYDPSGKLVAFSDSFQGSTEEVDFTATTTGTYTIQVHDFRFDPGTFTFLGVAWNPNTNDAITPLTGATGFPLNSVASGQTTDRGHSFWDTYGGPAAACTGLLGIQDGLEKVYRIKTPSAGDITAGLSSISPYPGVNDQVHPIILKKSGPLDALNNQVVGCGDTSAVATGQPAGTYLVVIDGSGGSVAQFTLSVGFAPAAGS